MGPMLTWNMDFAGFYPQAEHPHWFSISDAGRDPLRAYLTLKNAATRGPADLWLEKELIGEPEPRQNLVYVIRYTNIGGELARGVMLTDTLPAATEYVSDTGGGVAADGKVVWSIGTVITGTREAITLTLRLADAGAPGSLLTNAVQANVMAGEPYTDDNLATVSTPLPDLSIRKSLAPNTPAPGDPITYTLVFSNAGRDTARGVVITDAIPVSVTVQSVVSGGVTITDTGATPSYVWQVQDLEPGQGGVIAIGGVLSGELSGGYVLTNTAVVAGITPDGNPSNNRCSISTSDIASSYLPLIQKGSEIAPGGGSGEPVPREALPDE
jgi:uncharacterized repeat protein (TIGR01451 family)